MGGKKGTKGGAKASWVDIVSKGKTKGKTDQNVWKLVTIEKECEQRSFQTS